LSNLAVIVITKNEEENIEACLESVRWADEIVVVDGGSSDRTAELARSKGAKVFERKWDGYGAAKNFGLAQCTAEWVLWLDADERVTEQLGEEIRTVLRASGSINGYELPRLANFLGKWIHHCGWYPGYVLRLFRRQAGRFTEDRVHERLVVEGTVAKLRNDLLHYTDPSLSHYFEKFNRYTTLAAEKMASQGERFRINQVLVRPPWVFVRMYILRAGFLDGFAGFVLSLLSSFYVFVKYTKLWELSLHSSRNSGNDHK
jgi:glycosyltransferase involved in cell wall biosynthesis